jgi:hypothetical protein
MELNVGIVIPQLVENMKFMKKFPLFQFYLSHPIKIKNFIRCVFQLNESFSKTFCKTNNTYE